MPAVALAGSLLAGAGGGVLAVPRPHAPVTSRTGSTARYHVRTMYTTLPAGTVAQLVVCSRSECRTKEKPRARNEPITGSASAVRGALPFVMCSTVA